MTTWSKIVRALNTAAILNVILQLIGSIIYGSIALGVGKDCAHSVVDWAFKSLTAANSDVVHLGVSMGFASAALVYGLCRASLPEARELGAALLLGGMFLGWILVHQAWVSYEAHLCVSFVGN